MLIHHLVTSRPLIFPKKEAVLSPCNFVFDSLHSEVLSTLNSATHEMEDPFAKPTLIQGGPGSVRFGYGLGVERFERFRFSAPAVLCKRVCFSFSPVLQYSFTGKGGSGFCSWKALLAVPDPLSVSGKTFRRFRFPLSRFGS